MRRDDSGRFSAEVRFEHWQDTRRFRVIDRAGRRKARPVPAYKQRQMDRARRAAIVQALCVLKAQVKQDLLDLLNRRVIGA